MYDLLVQNYVVDYSQYLESVDFPFEFPDTITFEAVVEDGSFQRKGESYVQATNDVKTAIQAASDVFSYDYPQAFWFRGSNYGYRVSCVRDGSSSTGYRGTFKNFTFKPANREISENAHTRMGDFMDGVQSAVAELNEQTLGMDMEQKIKRIHDYICQRVTYRNDNTFVGAFCRLVVSGCRSCICLRGLCEIHENFLLLYGNKLCLCQRNSQGNFFRNSWSAHVELCTDG